MQSGVQVKSCCRYVIDSWDNDYLLLFDHFSINVEDEIVSFSAKASYSAVSTNQILQLFCKKSFQFQS